jgi:hypothetical protein
MILKRKQKTQQIPSRPTENTFRRKKFLIPFLLENQIFIYETAGGRQRAEPKAGASVAGESRTPGAPCN